MLKFWNKILASFNKIVDRYSVVTQEDLILEIDDDYLFILNRYTNKKEKKISLDDIYEIKFGTLDDLELSSDKFWDVITQNETYSFSTNIQNVQLFTDFFNITIPPLTQISQMHNKTISIWKKNNSQQ